MPFKPLCLVFALLAATPALADATKVDERALRYYAAHNDSERVQAEIRRLQSLYPDWVVPTDLTGETGDREKDLWAIFATGDMPALERAIAALKASDPGFTVSPDLAGKMAARQARDSLIAASEAGDNAKVVAVGEAHPEFFGCADLDVSWRVAAAYAGLANQPAALAAYGRLLDTCTDAPGRLATVQKAIVSLGAVAGHGLLTHEKSPGEFDALRPDFARAAISRQLTDKTGDDPDAADLAVLVKAAEAGPKPDDAALLGWWYRSRHQAEQALAQFQTAATLAGPDMAPKIAEGLVLSLADLGRRADATRVAHDNRGRSDDLARLYVGLAASMFEGNPRPDVPQILRDDYTAAVTRLADPAGAEVLGWYFLDRKDAAAAGDWFGRGLGWKPSESLASGAVYAALLARDTAAAKALVERWHGDYPSLAAIRFGGPAATKPAGKDAIIVAFERRNYSGCVSLAIGRAKLGADLSLIEGWCLMGLNRPVEAGLAFDRAMAGSGRIREDAAYGKSLAAMAAGDVRGAVTTAMAGVNMPERRAEISAAALASEAKSHFDARDYAGALEALRRRAAVVTETSDLALLRGWCLWHLGDRSGARQLFIRLDDLLSTPATRQAVAAAGGR